MELKNDNEKAHDKTIGIPALLEPIELNEIPLNDLEQPTTKDNKATSQKAHGAKISPVEATKPKLANAFPQQPNAFPIVQYQKTAVKTASASSQPGKEIILVPPAATFNASAGSSASAAQTSGNNALNGGKTEELSRKKK